MRASVLSEEAVIQMVNKNFVPVAINVTRDGFPEAIPALGYVKAAYTSNWRYAFGFAGCLVVDCEGQYPLAHSASANAKVDTLGAYYRIPAYIEFLVKSLEKHAKVMEIKSKFRQFDLMGGFGALSDLLRQFQQDIAEHAQALQQFQTMLQSTGMDEIAMQVEKK